HDNKDHLPDAGTGNAPDALMSPRAVGLPPWTNFGPDLYVLPSIGQLLGKYLNSDNRVWICPARRPTVLSGPGPIRWRARGSTINSNPTICTWLPRNMSPPCRAWVH